MDVLLFTCQQSCREPNRQCTFFAAGMASMPPVRKLARNITRDPNTASARCAHWTIKGRVNAELAVTSTMSILSRKSPTGRFPKHGKATFKFGYQAYDFDTRPATTGRTLRRRSRPAASPANARMLAPIETTNDICATFEVRFSLSVTRLPHMSRKGGFVWLF